LSNHSKAIHLEELDFLRGFAALFMVINHMGYALLSNSALQTNSNMALLFVTSFAPVLFFFTSGLGYGIQSTKPNQKFHLLPTLYKFGLLMFADLFFALSQGRMWGLDFLGFIAVIVLLLDLIRSSKYVKLICIFGIIFVFLLRFYLAPKISLDNQHMLNAFISWSIGNSVDNVSYPFSPWFAYPLFGLIIGLSIAKQQDFKSFIQKNSNKVSLLVIAILFGACSAFLFSKGFSFFRWGTLGIGFFTLSFTVIALSMLTALTAPKFINKKLFDTICLGGPASLAIVPIHYFLINLLESMGIKKLENYLFAIVFISSVIASFILAKQTTSMFQRNKAFISTNAMVVSCWLITLAFAIATYYFSHHSPLLSQIAQLSGQLTICFLFNIKINKTLSS
jgi:uncharacterized membrane protein